MIVMPISMNTYTRDDNLLTASLAVDDQPKDVQGVYNKFIDKRNAKKKKIYFKISVIGMFLFILGFLAYAIFKGFVSPSRSIIFPAFSAIGIIILVAGVLTFTFVPFDEVDIEESAPKWLKVLIMTIWGTCHIYMAQVPPYLEFGTTFLCMLELISLLIVQPTNPFPWFNVKMSFLLGYSLFGVIPTLFLASFDVGYIDNNQLIDGLAGTFSNLGFFVGITIGTLFFLASMYIFYKVREEVVVFRTNNNERLLLRNDFPLLVRCGYIYIAGAGLYHFLIGIDNFISNIFRANAVSFIVIGCSLITMPLFVAIVTPKVIYTFLSKKFDMASDQMEVDSSFLAELVMQHFFQIDAPYWVQSSRGAEVVFYEGRIVSVFDDYILVGNHSAPPESNLAPHVKVELQKKLLKKNDLLDWAKKNIRKLIWSNFKDDLLLRSPRELTTEEDKVKTYELSIPVTEGEKIDYFVSHSWVDDKIQKVTALKKFVASKGSNLSFWLDKVCIDQKNPTQSLQVLPINIASCNKFLILFGLTYIERLWCVWELYTLFAFCRPEIAIERIEIVVISSTGVTEREGILSLSQQLETFSLDKSSCFDPNERLKLYTLICTVGKEKFEKSIKLIGAYLRKRYDL